MRYLRSYGRSWRKRWCGGGAQADILRLWSGLSKANRARYRAVTRRGSSDGRGLASPADGAPVSAGAQVISFPPLGLPVLLYVL